MADGVAQQYDLSPDVLKQRLRRWQDEDATTQTFLRAFVALIESASRRLDELYDRDEPLDGDDLASACVDLQAVLDLHEHYQEHR